MFLFDEPLSNLDAKLRVDMRTEIKRLHASTGTTIVYVTHDQIEAMTLATKIAVLKDGVLQQVGTPAEIYNPPANLFVADFMGSPSMNLLKARVARENGRAVLKLVQTGAKEVTLAPPRITAAPLQDGRDLILGIRPEAITDRDGADRNSPPSRRSTAMSTSWSPPAPTPLLLPSSAEKNSPPACGPTSRSRPDR